MESITPIPYLCFSSVRCVEDSALTALSNRVYGAPAQTASPLYELEIVTKDVRRVRLLFESADLRAATLDRINQHAFFGAHYLHEKAFAAKHHMSLSQSLEMQSSVELSVAESSPAPSPATAVSSAQNKPSLPLPITSTFQYDPKEEFERLSSRPTGDQFYFKDQGPAHELFPTYPQYIIVPEAAKDDALLKDVGKYRSSHRIPAVVWIHPSSGASLTRCSQPLSNFISANASDQKLVKAIWTANPNYKEVVTPEEEATHPLMFILDARSKAAASYNMVVGGGYESTLQYGRCRIEFAGIGNIHAVRDSFNALTSLCSEERIAEPAEVMATQWYHHIRGILLASEDMVDNMEKGVSILTHCSDGWDRTSQLCALIQLMLDPYSRTAAGFCKLIQKEWLSFGHKFCERCSFGEAIPATTSQASPVFLQYMDAVNQVVNANQTLFEFTPQFLIRILDVIHGGQYGDFMANCEAVYLDKFAKTTASCWPALEKEWHEDIGGQYHNPTYVYTSERTKPVAQNPLNLWSAFYHRYNSRYYSTLKNQRVDYFTNNHSRITNALSGDLANARAERDMWRAAFQAAMKDKPLQEVQIGLAQLQEYIDNGITEFEVHFKVDQETVRQVYCESPYRVRKAVTNLSALTMDTYIPNAKSSHPPSVTPPESVTPPRVRTGADDSALPTREVVLVANIATDAQGRRVLTSRLLPSAYQNVINTVSTVSSVATSWGKYLWDSAASAAYWPFSARSPSPSVATPSVEPTCVTESPALDLAAISLTPPVAASDALEEPALDQLITFSPDPLETRLDEFPASPTGPDQSAIAEGS